ncbi:MAG: transcription elongation factor GreA, partial [Sinomicrobium sp.]|nr:transcription elongation factor GreA [Sinomicrobium sp.]
MAGINYLSQEGYDKLKTELDELKTQGRSDVAKAIAEAREKGDLSENAEYDAAKEAQGLLELKINDLEKIMANAR